VTSLSKLDLDSVAREIAETPPPTEPSPELTAKAGAYLERRGWTRAVAGEADFAAASLALARCSVQRRGIFAFGAYGCGKTAFVRAIRPLFEPVHFVPLNDPEYAELMDLDLWPNWNAEAMRCSVILDDLGAESAITDYGIKRETAAEFVVRYHRQRMAERVADGPTRRLFVTTNLTGEQIAERYTARLTSRIKELCIPLHLKGADKRKWGGAKFGSEEKFRSLDSKPLNLQASKPPNLQTSKLPINLQASKHPNIQTSKLPINLQASKHPNLQTSKLPPEGGAA
jgi:hypothetical protein